MNKKQLFIKLLVLVFGGVAVFLLSSCFTSLRILSCKKSCVESCNSCSANQDDIYGEEYGIYYKLDNSGEFYWVSEVGYKETEVVIPETYDGLPVMGIRSGTFEYYNRTGACGGGYYFGLHLKSLTLPKTIRFIEQRVFGGGIDINYHAEGVTCDKLIFEGTLEDWCDINFDCFPLYGGTELYIDGELLTDLVIPESVTKIKDNAFAFYSKLQTVTLHENITEIGNSAFWDSSITTLTFPCKDLTILQGAFCYCIALERVMFTGENLVLANGNVFAECSALKEVEWNTVNITHIPEYTFTDCVSLESFVVPASVETIGEHAFFGCFNLDEVHNLSKINVVAGSTSHGYVAYYAGIVHNEEADNSYILTEGDYKFVISDEGTTLFKYTGEGGVLNLPERNDGYDIRANTFAFKAITAVYIPKCVTAIGASAFHCCEDLQLLSGGDGVVTVESSAFNGCVKLPSVELDAVEEIGSYAFGGCTALKTVVLPKLSKINGSDVFGGCEALKSLTLPVSLTEIYQSAFDDCIAEITYDGTLEQWAEVTLPEHAFTDVTVICSDGEWVGKI